MQVLVVGGTRFVGRHLVGVLVERGHRVTMFNRGRSEPGLFADDDAVEHVAGDRDEDLSSLAGHRWDVVIDTSAYRPAQVTALLDAVAASTGAYVLVSSVSVYADPVPPGAREDAALLPAADGDEEIGLAYGELKVACEEAARRDLPADRLLVLRPGFVVGPHDYTWRFPYWVDRIAVGGRVLAPGPGHNPLQVVDARDLAMFAVRSAEVGARGTFHVAGPEEPMSLADVLDCIRVVVRSDAEVVWADRHWLAERGVGATSFPLVVPADERAAAMRIDIGRARGAGLSLRPLADTVADTLRWMRDDGTSPPSGPGIDRERERALIAAMTDDATHRPAGGGAPDDAR